MRSCRDISTLVSQGLDKKLSLRERFTIWLHVMMCTRCRNFQKQTQFIRKAARHYIDDL
ncbi:zf-HC2 domain-containing protein [Methylobacter sp.]|uniref:zf-HC2 domain-containing protein n=1 Tax=Methylobacter sp. TaxID=2051955 RepID=UPI0012222F8D|nr:zf-HC2 domain-containing protein [Methylobacter sp.]TAK64208.1 MAG: zf-HC2 domain-containing protein [Methylobacter sp.]